MRALAFDVRGKLAHFRKPDTTATQLTYPFITPTAAKGLVGAILGIEDFVTNDQIGVKILNPVRTVSQQLSMLGKDAGASFNRPTTIELLINPSYRIYYTGQEYTDRLIEFLEKDHAVYPTYLGTAYALTKPVLQCVYEDVSRVEQSEEIVETEGIVPTVIIEKLHVLKDRYFSRAGGFMHHYKGERIFEKSIDFIYERNGQSIRFSLYKSTTTTDVNVARLGDEVICLF